MDPAAAPQAAAPPPPAAPPAAPPPQADFLDTRDERLRQLDSLRRAKAAAALPRPPPPAPPRPVGTRPPAPPPPRPVGTRPPQPAALSPATAAGALAALTSQARQHTTRRDEEPQRRRDDERIDVDDSPNPVDVKKALTFKGATVAWAILKRHKIIESRPVRLPTGGWIAAHVGKGAFKGDYSARIANCPAEESLLQRYMGCIVGLFKIKDCRRPNNCGGSVWAEGPVCNVVEAVIELPSPVPVSKGKLHVWLMDETTRLRVAEQLAALPISYTDLRELPPYEPIIGPITPGRNRSYNRTDDLPSSTRPPSWVDEAAPLPVRNDYGARYGGYDTGGYYAGMTGGYAQQYAAAHPLAPAAAHYYAPPPGYYPPPQHGYASPGYPPPPAPRRHSPPPRSVCEGALAWYDGLQRRPPGG